MSANIDTFSVTDLRQRTTKVFKKAKELGYVYLMKNSKQEAALVDASYLGALQEAYEEYLDLVEFDKTIGLKRVSLSGHKKKYNP